MQKYFNLGKELYIFTSELYAILMALKYIGNIPLAIFNIAICVHSKCVLYALQNWDCKVRKEVEYTHTHTHTVKYLIHCVISRGKALSFAGYSLIVVSIGMNHQVN